MAVRQVNTSIVTPQSQALAQCPGLNFMACKRLLEGENVPWDVKIECSVVRVQFKINIIWPREWTFPICKYEFLTQDLNGLKACKYPFLLTRKKMLIFVFVSLLSVFFYSDFRIKIYAFWNVFYYIRHGWFTWCIVANNNWTFCHVYHNKVVFLLVLLFLINLSDDKMLKEILLLMLILMFVSSSFFPLREIKWGFTYLLFIYIFCLCDK